MRFYKKDNCIQNLINAMPHYPAKRFQNKTLSLGSFLPGNVKRISRHTVHFVAAQHNKINTQTTWFIRAVQLTVFISFLITNLRLMVFKEIVNIYEVLFIESNKNENVLCERRNNLCTPAVRLFIH